MHTYLLIFFFYSDTSIFHYLSIFALESRPYTAKQAKIVIRKPGKFSQKYAAWTEEFI